MGQKKEKPLVLSPTKKYTPFLLLAMPIESHTGIRFVFTSKASGRARGNTIFKIKLITETRVTLLKWIKARIVATREDTAVRPRTQLFPESELFHVK